MTVTDTQAKQWSDGPISFYGLSTDTKPTSYEAPGNKEQAVPARSTFLETNTGNEFIYTGTQWVGITTPVAFPTDGPNFDAFARLRVSNPETIFDSKQIHNDGTLLWDDQEVSGGSTTSTWTQNEASTKLGVALNTAGNRTRQTYRRFNYQPGKSQLYFLTGTLDSSGGGSGITRGWGVIDDNNGFAVVDKEGTINLRSRTKITGSPVDTDVAQTSWNIDTMDGNGASGITLDFSKAQILVIDQEWLGVGRVRVGFVVDGVPYYVHQFVWANNNAGVYNSTPNLPIRYWIDNDGTGAASELEVICGTVISEGGTQAVGVNRCNSNAATAVVAPTSGTIYALCGLKLKAANLDGVVKLINISVLELNTVDYEWLLYFNPTLANAAPTFNNQANSTVMFAVGVGGASPNSITGGTVIAAGYVKGGKETGAITVPLDTAQQLGSAIDGTEDEIWLAARPLGANADFLGSIAWREIS